MRRELAICNLKANIKYWENTSISTEHFHVAIKALRDIEEIEKVINCDADAETKCKMISNILTAKPHYFEEEPQESEE